MKTKEKSRDGRFDLPVQGTTTDKCLLDPDQAFTQQPSLEEDDVAILKLCQKTSEDADK